MADLGRAFNAYQAFVLSTKLYWTRELYPRLRAQHSTDTAAGNDSEEQLKTHLEKNLDYAYFSWFKRHLQRMKYTGQYGLVPAHEPHRLQFVSVAYTTTTQWSTDARR